MERPYPGESSSLPPVNDQDVEEEVEMPLHELGGTPTEWLDAGGDPAAVKSKEPETEDGGDS